MRRESGDGETLRREHGLEEDQLGPRSKTWTGLEEWYTVGHSGTERVGRVDGDREGWKGFDVGGCSQCCETSWLQVLYSTEGGR